LQHGPFRIRIDHILRNFCIALGLSSAGRRYAQRHFGAWLAVTRQLKIAVGDRRHINPQVKPIQQRARYAAQIVSAAFRGAGAGPCGIRHIAATAGIGGGNEHEATWIFHMGIGTRDHHFACFNRLAQGF